MNQWPLETSPRVWGYHFKVEFNPGMNCKCASCVGQCMNWSGPMAGMGAVLPSSPLNFIARMLQSLANRLFYCFIKRMFYYCGTPQWPDKRCFLSHLFFVVVPQGYLPRWGKTAYALKAALMHAPMKCEEGK